MSIDIKSMLIGRVQGKKTGGSDTIINVDELPLENVDQQKLYHTSETIPPKGQIYINADWLNKPLTLSEYEKNEWDSSLKYTFHIIDENSVEEFLLTDYDSGVGHIYINLETGEALVVDVYNDGPYNALDSWFQWSVESYMGVISDPSEITDYGYYFCVYGQEKREVFGIPNTNDDRNVYHYTKDNVWGRLSKGILIVDEIPSEADGDYSGYKLSTAKRLYYYDLWTNELMTLEQTFDEWGQYSWGTPELKYYYVDELPDEMEPYVFDENNQWVTLPLYIVNDTGIAYASYTGSCDDVEEFSGSFIHWEFYGPCHGNATSTSEMLDSGFYCFAPKRSQKAAIVYDGQIEEYVDGIAYKELQEMSVNLNSQLSQAESNLATKTVKYDIASRCVTDEGLINLLGCSFKTDEKGHWLTRYGNSDITTLTISGALYGTGSKALGKDTWYYQEGCQKLTTLVIEEGVKEIENGLAYNCKALKTVTLPDSIEIIGGNAFDGCDSLTSINIPNGITVIPNGFLNYCQNVKLTSTQLPDHITEIGDSAFCRCNLIQLEGLPSALTKIGNNAFFSCNNLTVRQLPEGLKEIGESGLAGCRYVYISRLPEGFETLGMNAFSASGMSSSLTFPTTLKTIGSSVISHCSNIKTLTFLGTPESIHESAFWGSSVTDIYVPWSEGEISGAPWNATSATIHYDQTTTT